MGTLVTLLFVLHCYFVSTGQTTYEFLQGAWKKRPNPFNKGLRANWIAVVRDAAMHRSKCDDTPTIETRSTSGLGEYVGTKIVSPREDDKTIGEGDDSPQSIFAAFLEPAERKAPGPEVQTCWARRPGAPAVLA